MRYYEILVASMSFHGKEPLTYSSDRLLEIGSVVKVPLGQKIVIGIVKNEVSKPDFKLKSLLTLPVSVNIPKELLELLNWLASYYPAPIGQITSLFVPSSLVSKSRFKPEKNVIIRETIVKLPKLTKDQKNALNIIRNNTPKPILLHGDTGTGKTRVYIDLAREQLDNNRSVIIMTPEIGLTPQLVESFSSQFGNKVLVTHSQLTSANKRDVWLKIANSNDPVIVIGPRSALFSPIKNLGLIVIDEFHDSAYKQEQSPHYIASRVAAQLARFHNCQLVLGSATPNIVDYYNFEAKKLPIVRMTEPAITSDFVSPVVDIVAISNRDNFVDSQWISTQMIQAIRNSLNNGNQSLVFLNRRGSARVVACQSCGWQALCQKCDIPMTYHGDIHRMICHTCGLTSSTPTTCAICNSTDIVFRSIGTKALVKELQKIFPEARIARFDSDSKKTEHLSEQYKVINEGAFDILVGTQMITKGLDLTSLSVVGILTADTALTFPDYTAEEVTYQQLSQAIGRVGRGHVEGHVIIQTYYPENSSLNAAVNKNYSLFYKQQITERKRFLFPPFFYILKIECGRKNSSAAKKACENLYSFINNLPLDLDIIGPAPSYKQKQNNKYYYQLIIKSKKRTNLTEIIKRLPSNFAHDIDPTNLL
ncbi:primosomal protein N' [Candidatus Saccharibacteria bacterium]|nr:primosomal protein N' [Candidatus Saccharibacteria bacterium]